MRVNTNIGGEQDVTQTASWSDKRSTQFCSPLVPVGEPATYDKPHTICMENYQYMITNGFYSFSLFLVWKCAERERAAQLFSKV